MTGNGEGESKEEKNEKEEDKETRQTFVIDVERRTEDKTGHRAD